MTGQDLIVTPVLLLLLILSAYFLRPYFTTKRTRAFFMPALLIKLLGALLLGVIYQFYYQGGDTFTYFNLGSIHIWDAFLDSPIKAFELIFGPEEYSASTYDYASRIYSFGDQHSYFVVRLAGLLGLLTFNTYSGIAILFATLSFTGVWSMYVAVLKLYPRLRWSLAISILFVPSVVFWGSGLLKDTLTLGALGWLTWGVINLLIFQQKALKSIVCIVIAALVIYIIKIYILLCLILPILLWVVMSYARRLKSYAVRWLVLPISLAIVLISSYYIVRLIGETSHRYSLDKFSYTAETTAKWNYYVSQQEGGSGYTLGDTDDFSTEAIIQRSPQAVWVALFRPYLWESSNIAMLVSAFENLLLLGFTIYVLYKSRLIGFWKAILQEPFIFFSLVFVIAFAFSIGISSYNFGTLVRYKIPLIPFFLCSLFIILDLSGRNRRETNALLRNHESIILKKDSAKETFE